MERINILIDEIIARAQKKADNLFTNFPAQIELELLETSLTREEFLRNHKRIFSDRDKLLATYYNIRDNDYLRGLLKLTINSKDWPVSGALKYLPLRKDKMYSRIFQLVLSTLFLRMNHIDYLQGLIDDKNDKPKGLQCLPKYKVVDLEFIFSNLRNTKLHNSVNETNFVGAFQGATLPEKIKWIGNNTELATLVRELTGETPIPSLINSLFEPKFIYDSQSTKRIENKAIIKMVNAAVI